MRLYAGDMHLNRKDKKTYVEIQKKNDFLGNKMVKTFFSSPKFSSPMDYLASIMF